MKAKTKDICQRCENVYTAGPFTHFCPKCIKIMRSENAKKRQLNKLGTAFRVQNSKKNNGK